MAAIPRGAVDEAVLTQQLSVQRYATALLVRLRRLMRQGEVGPDDDDSPDLTTRTILTERPDSPRRPASLLAARK